MTWMLLFDNIIQSDETFLSGMLQVNLRRMKTSKSTKMIKRTSSGNCMSEESSMVWPYDQEPGSLAHDAMHGMSEGARGRGRPKITWLTYIAEWVGSMITACVREAEDQQKKRQKWRRIVK